VPVNLRTESKQFAPLALCFALGCSGGAVAADPERVTLFETVTNGSIQRAHPCQMVRDTEASLRFLPEADLTALRIKIGQAELDDVRICLAQVQAYDECFSEVPCDALEYGRHPAWLLGSELAPCACGVDTEHLNQPFGTHGVLPDTLAACTGLLPISHPQVRPGESGQCPE